MNKPVPIQQQERILVLDVLRGIAILGILIVNMGMINTPYIYLDLAHIEMWTGLWDQITNGLIVIFAQGKFYTLFSFLFGYGFIIFLERAEQKVKKPHLLLLRRLFILFVIGLIHAYLIWWGDILMTYAAGGLVLLAFYRQKPKTLLVWAASIICILVLFIFLLAGLFFLLDSATFTNENQKLYEFYQKEIAASLYAYGEGSFIELMNQRIKDVHFVLSNVFYSMFTILPMFLLGAYTAKKQIIQLLEQHRQFIRIVGIFGIVVGISLNILKFWSASKIDPIESTIYDFINALAMIIGDPALCLGYIASIILIFDKAVWRSRLIPFAHVGRMAISNYLFQSIICTSIFYSYGLGLYGQIRPLYGVILTLAIFSFQLYVSRLWMLKFYYGPVEWIWRSLTYGRWQPFKK